MYRFTDWLQAGVEYNPLADDVGPLLNLRAVEETERRPALILGTSSDRIGTEGGQAVYADAEQGPRAPDRPPGRALRRRHLRPRPRPRRGRLARDRRPGHPLGRAPLLDAPLGRRQPAPRADHAAAPGHEPGSGDRPARRRQLLPRDHLRRGAPRPVGRRRGSRTLAAPKQLPDHGATANSIASERLVVWLRCSSGSRYQSCAWTSAPGARVLGGLRAGRAPERVQVLGERAVAGPMRARARQHAGARTTGGTTHW